MLQLASRFEGTTKEILCHGRSQGGVMLAHMHVVRTHDTVQDTRQQRMQAPAHPKQARSSATGRAQHSHTPRTRQGLIQLHCTDLASRAPGWVRARARVKLYEATQGGTGGASERQDVPRPALGCSELGQQAACAARRLTQHSSPVRRWWLATRGRARRDRSAAQRRVPAPACTTPLLREAQHCSVRPALRTRPCTAHAAHTAA